MRILAILTLLLIPLHAATPKMWIKDKGRRIPLRIDQIQADVTITGSIAETVLTLRFRNETKRMQEGEFVMPLPEGSTVSSYALEVNGKLRDGVAVEKKQARHAYETIKRQMIDPGLVEREAGNNYRTKVFPIPAEGTKLVRIGYIEHLRSSGGKLNYQLPTDYPGLIDDFSCTIRHEGDITIDAPGLTFEKPNKESSRAKAKKQQLPKAIKLTTARLNQSRTWLEMHGEQSYFLIDLPRPAAMKEQPRRKPAHINLIWDASESCAQRPIKRELNVLDHYFKHLGNTRVTLQVLRNTLQDAGEFQIKNGDWKKLRSSLENTFYDGGSAYQNIKKSQKKADLTLLFTDGDTAARLALNTQQNTILFHSSPLSKINPRSRTGSVETIRISRTSVEDTLHQLTHTRFKTQPLILKSLSVLSVPRKDRIILLGVCQGTPTDFTIEHRNANGNNIRQKVPSSGKNTLQGTSTIRRMWAQARLQELENSSGNRAEIIAHCREHALVSDHTSLIVLERFKDYIRFNIPPPEPELRVKWEAERKKLEPKIVTREQLARQLARAWHSKLNWYQRRFTWFSENLLNRHQQTNIWLKALNEVFQPKDLDAQAYGAVETWRDQTNQLQANEAKLKSKQEYRQWLNQQSKLIKEWDKLAKLEAKRNPKHPLAISVRGLVKNPDTYRSDKPVTLKQSITLAGGTAYSGTLQYVSLYRNAHVLTYNLLSEKYQDVKLLPGDMIVVEPEPLPPGYGFDPFSDGTPSPKVDPTKAPAVSKKRIRFTDTLGDPFGGGSPRNTTQPDSVVIQVSAPQTAEAKDAAMEGFEKALNNGRDANAAYRKLKGKQRYEIPFYIQAARLLAKSGHPDLAQQVLSNIHEYTSPSSASRRAYAYWLGEIGLMKQAITQLKLIQKEEPKKLTNRLDVIRYHHRMNPESDVEKSYHPALEHAHAKTEPAVKVHVLTERNAYRAADKTAPGTKHGENLSADLRCVIYSADPSVKIRTEIDEPGETSTTGWSPSRLGGKLFVTPPIQEYMLKRAMPGTYQIKCRASAPVTVQLAIYSHWGSPEQTCQWTTVLLGPKKTIAAEYSLDLKD